MLIPTSEVLLLPPGSGVIPVIPAGPTKPHTAGVVIMGHGRFMRDCNDAVIAFDELFAETMWRVVYVNDTPNSTPALDVTDPLCLNSPISNNDGRKRSGTEG